jgi:hypothetical protein
MALDREVVDAVRDMDEHELRRLMMLATARLDKSGVSVANGVERGFRLREQMIRCGKPNCGRCPHGPYWYAYWREDGRRRSRYIGRLEDIDRDQDSPNPTDIVN